MARLNLPKQRIFQGPAAIWKRIIAFVIDLFIIDLVLFWPFKEKFIRFMPSDDASIGSIQQFFMSSPEVTRTLTLLTLVMGSLAVLYFALMEYKLGQSLGKMAVNIHIISDSKEMKFWQCLARSIIWLPMFPFMVFWILDPLYVLLNQNRQRLTEYISRTRTVENHVIV